MNMNIITPFTCMQYIWVKRKKGLGPQQHKNVWVVVVLTIQFCVPSQNMSFLFPISRQHPYHASQLSR